MVLFYLVVSEYISEYLAYSVKRILSNQTFLLS
ncbi:MAG: hypothetical protein ACI8VL_000378, partial [Bacteroidia bacterium]